MGLFDFLKKKDNTNTNEKYLDDKPSNITSSKEKEVGPPDREWNENTFYDWTAVKDPIKLDRIAFRDCLKQQTTSYENEDGFLVGTDNDNEIYLLHFYKELFHAYKVRIYDGKVKIYTNYSRRGYYFTDLSYIFNDARSARVHFETTAGDWVDIKFEKTAEYYAEEFEFNLDQSKEFDQFFDAIDTYIERIKESAEMLKKQSEPAPAPKGELREAFDKLTLEQQAKIKKLAQSGQLVAAIKEYNDHTHVGLKAAKEFIDRKLYI